MTRLTFFKSPADFRRWLEKNHDKATELMVGFYKRGSGRPSITWPESVDQALCFGWIEGVRRRIDEESYSIRFSPRRRGSVWSAINIKKATELQEQGLMHAAGVREFEKRKEYKSRIYSYENALRALDPKHEKRFRANKKAWKYFSEQPPWYRRVIIYWVVSAKKHVIGARRLARLIEDSAHQRRVGLLALKPKQS